MLKITTLSDTDIFSNLFYAPGMEFGGIWFFSFYKWAKDLGVDVGMYLVLPTIVSSMGYVVLSGNIHVDKQDTTFFTPFLWLILSTLSLINVLIL